MVIDGSLSMQSSAERILPYKDVNLACSFLRCSRCRSKHRVLADADLQLESQNVGVEGNSKPRGHHTQGRVGENRGAKA